MKYLIVAAHPDDELLGAGATIMSLQNKGNSVDLCIMCPKAEQRIVDEDEGDNDIVSETAYVCNKLAVENLYVADFPNLKMNLTPHIELVKFIEHAILTSKASVVITHHPSDTNNDHYQTSIACQEAIRIYQRRNEQSVINEVWYMEIPSSTDWSLNTSASRFIPNLFIPVQPSEIKRKTELLSHYSGALRKSPHPRSEKNIMGLASYRGGQAGCEYAEAFECVFRKL